MDVELEGKEASRELNKLRETCRKLRYVRLTMFPFIQYILGGPLISGTFAK